jgi:2-oxoglutarate dehydrogenase E2 component (dihydrolipoamide succinyltransferase)
MRITVPLPVLGDSTQTGVISEWVIALGAHVDEGETLVVVESDKAVVDVPSPVTGTLVEYLAQVDDEIDIGAPIAVIDDGAA